MNNFYKRFNKILLDKLAIKKKKENLEQENLMLKGVLKKYLDGISLNDDVLKDEKNPLLFLQKNVEFVEPQVNVTKTVVEGAILVVNTNLQIRGGPAPPLKNN